MPNPDHPFAGSRVRVRRRRARMLAPLAAPLAVLLLPGSGIGEERVVTSAGPAIVETVADGLVHPWAMAFLPDGSALVTERPGRLRHLSRDGTLSTPLGGVPPVDARGQGGLLDVVVDPDFAENRLVYMSYARPAGEGRNSTAVARARLDEDRDALADLEVIFVQEPRLRETRHYGSRLVFDGRGHLYVTLGERFTRRFREQAQALDSHLGKIVRIAHDGAVPADNPFVERPGALPEIWSYGHRNPQAAAMNPATGALVAIEHGPRGGDEINLIEPGVNYGWPVVSYGVNYDGTPVGSGEATLPGYHAPVFQWTPVIAPSGMVFYEGDLFPAWEGDILVGGLVARGVVRVALEGEAASEEERILTGLDRRIRDVAVGPDDAIWVLTDHRDGEILRVAPAE